MDESLPSTSPWWWGGEATSPKPGRAIALIALTILLCEVAIMLGLHVAPPLPLWLEVGADGLMLVLLAAPALYLFLYRPMVVQLEHREYMERALRASQEEQHRLQLRASLDGFAMADSAGRILESNYALCELTGRDQTELEGASLFELIDGAHRDSAQIRLQALPAAGSSRFESCLRRKDGQALDVELSGSHSSVHGGRIYLFFRDITERNRSTAALRDSAARLKGLFENLRSGVAVYCLSDGGEGFVFAEFNRAAERIDQIDRAQVIGRKLLDVFPAAADFGLVDVLRRVHRTGAAEHFPVAFYSDGRIAGWRDNFVYKLASGEVAAIYDDVTQEKQLEEQMRRLALHDALTGLPNRVQLTARCDEALAHAKANSAQLAVLFLDLDGFKPVNDDLGHEFGDVLLRQLAGRLLSCVDDTALVARIGGDEFVVLLPAVRAVAETSEAAGRILAAVQAPFQLAGQQVVVTCSIGIALYPDHGTDQHTLLRHADAAMYQAKTGGHNQARLFNSPDPVMVGEQAAVHRARTPSGGQAAVADGHP